MSPFRDVNFFEGIVRDLTSKHGQFRLFFQPLLAIIVGARLGVADAREHRAPFLMRLFRTDERSKLFKTSLRDLVLPMIIAMVIDGVVQYYTLDEVRPVAAFVVGMLLVWLPYACARALANRITQRRHAEHPAT